MLKRFRIRYMPGNRFVLAEDISQLLNLVRGGKLFALQDWIKAGKRIRAHDINDSRADVFQIAVETGFHSIVEELLRARKWPQDELSEALDWALNNRRFDLADLLFSRGAKLVNLDFETVCRTMDFNLMEQFLREGGDPGRDNAFARALCDLKARPLLRFYRSFRAEFSILDDQAALALYQAVDNDHVRWTALLAWAGADPFRPVPWNFEDGFPVDPEDCTNAATKATWRNNPEILKVLRLKPKPPEALKLLDDAGYKGNIELFRSLLTVIPVDQLNEPPHGSCKALERLVSRSVDRWTNSPVTSQDEANLKCIEMLLDAGAYWNPPEEDLRYARRWIKEHDVRYIVQLIRLLLYTPGAAQTERVLQLCDSKPLQTRMAQADARLNGELKELRKKLRSASS